MQTSSNQPLFIDRATVKSLLNYEELIPLMESALSKFSQPQDKGGVIQPQRSVIPVDGRGVLITMPSFSRLDNALATKLVTNFPNNRDVPSHQGCIVLFDDTNGSPLAILDAEEITGMRTAAISAVGVKHLRPGFVEAANSLSAAIIGCGYQAECHAMALDALCCFKEIRIGGRSEESLNKMKERFPERLPNGSQMNYSTDIPSIVQNADVICTVTSSTKPVLRADWIVKNSLIIGVGAYTPGAMELDPNLTKKCLVYVDSKVSANSESGDIILSGVEVSAELGQIINREVDTPSDNRLVFFKHLGLAVEDALSAKLVYDKIKSR